MDKRERIIQAAIEVFNELGIEKTKVSKIVKKAGVAQGTFYLYFPSKLSVMTAIAEKVIEQYVQKIDEMVDEEGSLPEQLNQIIEAMFTVSREFSDLNMLVYAGSSSSDQMNEWDKIYSPLYERVQELVAEHQEKGMVRDNTESYRLAKLMVGLIETTAEQVYLYDEYKEDEEKAQREALKLFLERALQ
ncbi:TetR family transcriptional regulator [Alkalibacillus aidingensis]|uniref:TetR family transcriptional regulator n=1 Tax=Alkalibacillus aidingensis TaxID=2747607 RepID=UPI0016602264|nr:TetR family transcriptional regulator [Alkalibacillus aidingensis]